MESKIIIIIFTALLLCSIGPRDISATPTFWDDGSEQEVVSAIISQMNDQELLGQVFMLGYVGQYPHLEFNNWIKNRQIGGVKIFSRNVKNLASLARDITNMQRSSMQGPFRIPLMVATDQEGGWVNHLKATTSKTAGNLALGAIGLLRDSYLTGYYIGQELREVGINMNFAPTIDIYSNPDASVIGPRAFSSDPRQTAFLALGYFRGMSRQGIICTAKHFPGHGAADKDSHGTLPVINISFAEMWERELLPYRLLIKEGLPAIMGGHLAYPEILDNNDPSSLSPYFSYQVLREKMGFEGVLVTDDLEMNGALVGGLTTADASQAALEAGNDMILIAHTPRSQEQAWNRLLRVIGKEPAFRQRIEQAVARILKVKWRAFRGENPVPLYPDPDQAARAIPSPESADFFWQNSVRSVTMVKDMNIPFLPGEDEKLLIVGQFPGFLEEGLERYPQADTFLFPYSPFYYSLDRYRSAIVLKTEDYDTVIFCLANFNSLEILKSLENSGKRILVISTLTPVYLREIPWVTSSIAVYGTSRESFKSGFGALIGDFIPEGKLPVKFF